MADLADFFSGYVTRDFKFGCMGAIRRSTMVHRKRYERPSTKRQKTKEEHHGAETVGRRAEAHDKRQRQEISKPWGMGPLPILTSSTKVPSRFGFDLGRLTAIQTTIPSIWDKSESAGKAHYRLPKRETEGTAAT